MSRIDLTPFGFTPTENLAYGALLDLGPSSGYGLAKELSIARANAYQALNGLVGKGAAVRTDEQPQRYRAERPDAVLARLVGENARRLDQLEQQIAGERPADGDSLIPVVGRRSLADTALRTAGREPSDLNCIGPSDLIAELSPAWRHRQVRGWTTRLWTLDGDDGSIPVSIQGTVDASRLEAYFGGPVFLLTVDGVALVVVTAGEASGYWTSDRTIVGSIQATIDLVTTTQVA